MFSSRRRHTRWTGDWSSDVCSSDLLADGPDLNPLAVRRLVRAWQLAPGELFAATYGGVRSHPVVIDRKLWESVPEIGRASCREREDCTADSVARNSNRHSKVCIGMI